MGVVRFYHLTRSDLPHTLGRLLERAVAAGLRSEVRTADPPRVAWLDAALWLGDEAGFLPHGVRGGPHDARQPVLISAESTVAAGIDCLMAVDGAEIAPEEAGALDRLFVIFDGGDASALERARAQWTALCAAGAQAEYWSEASGKWMRER